ncbi:DUF3139 domain-containing protein [Paenibacillus sp. sptzw28]|uniref:DUF3139 domain-containing protein n=1 Tax=Paenibacillus sp. sptzw28 TaxID=715179 RepID=UPI001C6F35A6|nr:DUF3139 domain-containing protein [Paenibacillus sp. sptzw28]QYR20902.1 DUF3139 domain-containing protein [Paenibacillus sp. sptzw28]
MILRTLAGTIVVVSILIVAFTVGAALYINFKLNSLESRIFQYLTTQKHYEKDEISNIDGAIGKLPFYQIRVIFKDEPNNVYIYREANNRIVQIYPDESKDSGEFKHKE